MLAASSQLEYSQVTIKKKLEKFLLVFETGFELNKKKVSAVLISKLPMVRLFNTFNTLSIKIKHCSNINANPFLLINVHTTLLSLMLIYNSYCSFLKWHPN